MESDAILETAAPPERPRHAPYAPRVLFSGLSREICQPLITLRAGFDLLLAGCEGPMPPEQRERVRALRVECDALLRLTRSYLDYAGLVRDPRPADWAEFRLGALLDECDRRFAARASARGIAWSCRLVGEDASVVADFEAFHRVVGQLVANALEHTPARGHVEFTGRAEGHSWFVEVADDGRGIPVGAIGQVFDPLVRHAADESLPADSQGHGMGLAFCRELIAQLGGEIDLRSEVGRGTTVTVRFPRERPDEAESTVDPGMVRPVRHGQNQSCPGSR